MDHLDQFYYSKQELKLEQVCLHQWYFNALPLIFCRLIPTLRKLRSLIMRSGLKGVINKTMKYIVEYILLCIIIAVNYLILIYTYYAAVSEQGTTSNAYLIFSNYKYLYQLSLDGSRFRALVSNLQSWPTKIDYHYR